MASLTQHPLSLLCSLHGVSPPSASGDESLCSPPEFLHVFPASPSHVLISFFCLLVALALCFISHFCLTHAGLHFSCSAALVIQHFQSGYCRRRIRRVVQLLVCVGSCHAVGWLSGWLFIYLEVFDIHFQSTPALWLHWLPVQLEL